MNKTFAPYLTEASRFSGIELSMIRSIMASASDDAVNLALGELSYPLPEILRQKAIEIIASHTPRYTPNAGLPELKEAIAEYSGVAISPDRVCVCNGAEEAVFLTAFSILDPGDRVAISDPDYTAYPAIVKLLGGDVVRLPHGQDLVSTDWQLWENILSQNVKALMLSNPCNPSGMFFSRQDIEKLVDICSRHRVSIIADEIYRDLCFYTRAPSFTDAEGAVFVVNGLSKSFCMSGWRIGWVISPQNLAGTLVKAKQYVSTCSNWLSQKLGVFALTDGKAAATEVLDRLSESRQYAVSFLKEHIPAEATYIADATPYLMLKCGQDPLSAARELASKGVITVPGAAFGDISAPWLRVNYGVDVSQLQIALPELARGLYPHQL